MNITSIMQSLMYSLDINWPNPSNNYLCCRTWLCSTIRRLILRYYLFSALLSIDIQYNTICFILLPGIYPQGW